MEQNKIDAIEAAREWLEKNPVYLDTETTGLSQAAEIVDLAVVDTDGIPLIATLIKPTVGIEKGASDVHGIRANVVEDAPGFGDVAMDLETVLKDRLVLIYNAEFDIRILRQSSRACNNAGLYMYTNFCTECVMELYAQFYGDWNHYHGSYRWQSQAKAGRQLGLDLPDDLHRAKADAQLCRLIVEAMAATPLPEEVI